MNCHSGIPIQNEPVHGGAGECISDVQAAPLRKASIWGVMSGTLDLIQRWYVGEVNRDGVLYFNPETIDKLDGLSLPMRFRGTLRKLALEASKLRVAVQAGSVSRSVKVGVGEMVREIKAGESHTFDLRLARECRLGRHRARRVSLSPGPERGQHRSGHLGHRGGPRQRCGRRAAPATHARRRLVTGSTRPPA